MWFFWFLQKLRFLVLIFSCKIGKKSLEGLFKGVIDCHSGGSCSSGLWFLCCNYLQSSSLLILSKSCFSSVWDSDIPPVVPCNSYFLLKIHTSKLVCKYAFWLKKQAEVELLISWVSYKQLLIRPKYFGFLHNSAWGNFLAGFLAKQTLLFYDYKVWTENGIY